MTRIATNAENALILFYMQQNRSQLDNLNAQISTGLTAQDYSGIAPQATHLVDLRAQASQQQDYLNTINTVNTRLQTMDLSLQQIQTSVQTFRALLPSGAFDPGPPSVQQKAQALLQQVSGYLNSQDGTRYLFAGAASGTPPVDLTGLPVGAAATLAAPVNAAPGAGGYYAGGTPIPPARVDAQVTVNYGITADDSSTFEPIIRVLNFLAQSPAFNPTNAADQASATTAGQMLDQALQSLATMRGNLGLQEAQLNTLSQTHQSTLNIAQNGVSDIVSVDQATAITQLQALETQMQASFSATALIEKLSLVNFLS